MRKKISSLFPWALLGNSSIVLIGAIGLILGVAIAASLGLMHLHKQAHQQASLATESLASSLQQTFDGLIDTIDIALLTSADEITRQMSAGKVNVSAISQYLTQNSSRISHVAFIRASNERGDVIYGQGVLTPSQINTASDDYFIYLRDHPQAGLFIAKPVLGKMDNTWVWKFARRINKADGTFGGVVWAVVKVDEIQNMLSQVKIGAGDSIALRDAELGLIARNIDKESRQIPAGDKKLSTPFKTALHNNRNEGTYISGATSIDNISRMHSYQRSAKYGYTINAGRSMHTALTEWRRQVWVVSALVLTLTLIVAAYARHIIHAWRRQDQYTAQLEEHQQSLRIAAAAFEAKEGIMITDTNGTILRTNKAFTKITGYTADEAIGQNPRLLSSGQHDKAFYMALWNSITSDGFWEGEILNKRKNGDIYPEHLTISAIKNDDDLLTHYVASFGDITQHKLAEEKIQTLSFFDTLTALPNRRNIVDRIKLALASHRRTHGGAALLLIDLNDLKSLNDTLGHHVGDLLLQQVAERLTSCVRNGDSVARTGGDEFTVLLENLSKTAIESAAQSKLIANKIITSLNLPYTLGDNTHSITASIGITLFEGEKSGAEEAMKQVDIAMHQAKKLGQNSVCFYDPQMQTNLNARVIIERELRTALEQQQFQLHYQIQVNADHQPLGAEALIRWRHPERGMISPLSFIPIAEETGLILAIGQWVLNEACAQLGKWQQDLRTQDLTLAVNVSAKQFLQAGFTDQVQATVQKHGIDPTRLKLELTESMLIDSIQDVVAIMSTLNIIGIRFSLDDFGTGYSSLQYLKMLPLNQLKIDQSFVRDIATDSHDMAIVRTIIAMAHGLDLNVIAEGVETEEQRRLLMEIGCTHFQGYLFSKPVPIDAFEALLK